MAGTYFRNDITETVVSSAAPTVSDWKYQVGTCWINTTNNQVCVCSDNTSGAATWYCSASGSVIT